MYKSINDGETIKTFISMINPNRIKSHHYWIDIGKALYNIYKDNTIEGFKLWIELKKYTLSCEIKNAYRLYNEFSSDNHLTYKTLAWYAYIDSPEDFDKWHEKWIHDSLEQATSCLHSDVAEAFYRCYFLEFMTSSTSSLKSIYQFKDNKCKNIDVAIIKHYINGNFISKFEKLRVEIAMKCQESYDDYSKDSFESQIKKISKLIGNLKTQSFKKQIVSEILEKFYIENLKQKLDSNPNLISMTNGVIEITDNDARFRPGKPEDYILKATGVKWNEDLHWDHPHVKELKMFFEQFLPDKEVLNYFLKLIASCLENKPSIDNLIYVWIGQHNDGKNKIKKIFNTVFGEYSTVIPNSLLPTNEQLYELNKNKVIWVEDFNNNNNNNGCIELTGEDNFRKSNMYKSFKIFIDHNDIPNGNHDSLIKKNIRFIPFLKSDTTHNDFEQPLCELTSTFMWYLVQMFSKFRNERLDQPKIIEQYTQKYWGDHDIYIQFKNEMIENTENVEKIKVSNTYQVFKDWYRMNYDLYKIPHKYTFITEMTKLLGNPVNNTWFSFRFKTSEIDNI